MKNTINRSRVMKNQLALIFALVSWTWAVEFTERCGVQWGLPENTCSINGYVSSVSYVGLVEPSKENAAYLRIQLVDDQGGPLYSNYKPSVPFSALYYIEEAKASDALGMVTFSAMAMSAYNNKSLVSMVYKNDTENAAVFLISLKLQ